MYVTCGIHLSLFSTYLSERLMKMQMQWLLYMGLPSMSASFQAN